MTEPCNGSPGLPRLGGRALQLFWSVSAELEPTRERGNDEYAEVLAEFLAELESDMRRGEIAALPIGMRILRDVQERTGLGINAICRLLAAIGLAEEGLQALYCKLVEQGFIASDPDGGGAPAPNGLGRRPVSPVAPVAAGCQ